MKKASWFSGFVAAITFAAGISLAPVASAPAQAAAAAGPAWTCPSNFLQVGNNVFYQFNASTTPGVYSSIHTISTGTTGEISSGSLNGIGYNPADNYIWGTTGSGNFYKIGTDGVASFQFTSTFTTAPSSTGGDFMAPDLLVNASGTNWAITNVNTTKTVGGIAPKTSFTIPAPSTSWSPFDFVVVPSGTANQWKVYGLAGTSTSPSYMALQTATITYSGSGTGYTIAVNAAWTASLSTKDGGGASTAPSSSDSFGAQYSDLSGDLYAWGNSTGRMYHIVKSDLLAASSTLAPPVHEVAVSSATKPASQNDGASCKGAAAPTATSPTAGALDVYGVAGTPLVVNATNKTGNYTPLVSAGQYANTHWVNSVSTGSASQTAAATSPYAISGGAFSAGNGAFNLTDALNGYYTYTQATPWVGVDTVNYTINGTGAASVSNSSTLSIHMLGITSGTVPTSATNGTAITSVNFAAGGGTGGYTWTASGLPSGLTLTSGGQLSGTPTGGSGTVNVTITVTDPTTGLTYSQTYPMSFAATAVLTFDPNGGSNAPGSITLNAGSSVTIPSGLPTRSGYTFAGWNTVKAGGGTSYAASAVTSSFTVSTTLYAQWTANTYTVTYHTDASPTTGTAPPAQSFVFGGSVTISGNIGSPVMARSGNVLSSWNTAAALNGTTYTFGQSYGLAANIDLYPVWVANSSQSLTYVANGGTGTVPTMQVSTTDFTVLGLANCGSGSTACTLSRTGFDFVGWNTKADATGTNFAGGDTYPYSLGSGNLYAVWSPITYTLTYDLNGGTGSIPAMVSFNVTALPSITGTSPTRAGYTFGGWNTVANGSGGTYRAGDSFNLLANTVLYALWVPNTYTVTYNANGGSQTGLPGVQSFNFGSSATISSTVMTRTGYTFDGWNTAANKSGTNYLSGDVYSTAANLTLYALWTPIQYAVVYEKNGANGTAPARQSFTVISPATVSSNLTSTNAVRMTYAGYIFSGWNTTAAGDGTSYSAGSAYSAAADLTLYAQWTPITYNLTYHMGASSGGSTPANTSYTVRNPAFVGDLTLTRTGYVQAGWNTALDGSGLNYAVGDTFDLIGGGDLYPVWAIAGNYTVIYDPNNALGTNPASVSNPTNTAATIAVGTGLTLAGYTFSGWNTAIDGSGTAYTAGQSFTGSANQILYLYAQWTPVSYTLKYNLNGATTGTTPGDQTFTVVTGTTIATMNSAPTKPGYTFDGWWSNLPSGTGSLLLSAGDQYFQPGNITLYAVWIPNVYTVTYDLNGGTGTVPAVQSFTVVNGVTIANAVSQISRPGYTFDGWWNTAANGGGTGNYVGGDHYSAPADLTLYAVWKPITYSVIYDKTGGTVSGNAVPGKVDFNLNGSAVTIVGDATNMTKPGYTFVGWNTSANGSGYDYVAGDTYFAPADLTLYALWEANTYTVTYDANGGTGVVPADQLFTITSPAIIKGVPGSLTRSGYNFLGWWNTAANGTGGRSYTVGDVYSDPADLTLYALWEQVGYHEIVYDINGGTGSTPAPVSFNTTPQTIADPATACSGTCNLAKPGYSFTGWNTAADGTGTHLAVGAGYSTLADLKLYAEWTLVNYTLSYNCNYVGCPTNGSGAAPASNSFNAQTGTMVNATAPTRNGYTFVEWNTLANGTGDGYSPADLYSAPGNQTLYAIWDANAYQVFYDANGASGGSVAPSTFTFGSTVTIANSAGSMSYNGATLIHWNTKADDSGTTYALGATYGDAADLTLYAIWNFQVSYTLNVPGGQTLATGTAPSTQNFKPGTSATIASASGTPTVVGGLYVFRGWWSTSTNDSYAPGDVYSLPANLNLQGVWILATSHAVAYDLNGGYGPVPMYQTFASGSVTVATPDLLMQRDGYTFTGWNTAANGSGTAYAAGSSYSTQADVILFAVWTANTVVVSYDLNGLSATAPNAQTTTADHAVTVAVTASPTVDLTFAGWNTMADGTGDSYAPGDSLSTVTDLTLYAIWVKAAGLGSGPLLRLFTEGTTPVTGTPASITGTTSQCLIDPADQLCKSVVYLPGIGTWTLSAGTATFQAIPGFVGVSTITLMETAANGSTLTGPLYATVTKPAVNNVKTITGATTNTSSLTLKPSVIGHGKACLQPVDGPNCGSSVTVTAAGTFTLANGAITFKPAAKFIGVARALLVTTDANGIVTISPVEISVTGRQGVSITIGGFAPGSYVLTNTIKAAIKSFMTKNSSYKVMTCTGVTMGPTVLKTDAALALNRAKLGCSYALSVVKGLKVLPYQSALETNLGDHIRRIVISLND